MKAWVWIPNTHIKEKKPDVIVHICSSSTEQGDPWGLLDKQTQQIS